MSAVTTEAAREPDEAPALGAGVPQSVGDVLAASGRPLEYGVRRGMEARFGQRLAHVRVHDDSRAARSAQAIGAHAYAFGSDVVFGTGGYRPGTAFGDMVLGHELAHVVQQRGGALPGRIDFGPRTGPAEAQAGAAGALVAAGRGSPSITSGAAPALQMLDRVDALKAHALEVALDAIAPPGLGSFGLEVLANLSVGIGDELTALMASPEGAEVVDHVWKMASNPRDILAYQAGVVVGIGKGVGEQIVDIGKLLYAPMQMQMAITNWLWSSRQSHPSLMPQIITVARRAVEVQIEIDKAIAEAKKSPVAFLMRLGDLSDALRDKVMASAKTAGHDLVKGAVSFAKSSASEIGEKVGTVLSYVLVEVVLAAVTQGIGTAIKWFATAGSKVARSIREIGEKAAQAIKTIKAAASEAIVVLKSLIKGAMRELEPLIGKVSGLFDEVIALLDRMVGLNPVLADGHGVAGGAMNVGVTNLNRTTMSTVAELTGVASPRSVPRAAPAVKPPLAPKVEPKLPVPPKVEPPVATPPSQAKPVSEITPATELKPLPEGWKEITRPKHDLTKPAAQLEKEARAYAAQSREALAAPDADFDAAFGSFEAGGGPGQKSGPFVQGGETFWDSRAMENLIDAAEANRVNVAGPQKAAMRELEGIKAMKKPTDGPGVQPAPAKAPDVLGADAKTVEDAVTQAKRDLANRGVSGEQPSRYGVMVHTEVRANAEEQIRSRVHPDTRFFNDQTLADIVDLTPEEASMTVAEWLRFTGQTDPGLSKKVLGQPIGGMMPDLAFREPGGALQILDLTSSPADPHHIAKTIFYVMVGGR